MSDWRYPGQVENAAFERIKQVLDKYEILPKNSAFVVGISGGIDSIVLLDALAGYNEKFTRNWTILPVHVNPGFAGWRTKTLERFLVSKGFNYAAVEAPINQKLESVRKNQCFFCARARRRALIEQADSRSTSTIALAHHREDVAETVILNLLFSSTFSTMVPKQSILQGRFFLVRPLYFFDKPLIEAYARFYRLPVVRNRCPYAKKSNRMVVRGFLKRLAKVDPRVIDNIFHGITNVKTAYLP